MSIDKLSPISYEYPKYSLEQGKIKDSVDAALLSFDSSCNLTNPLEADTIAFSSNSATNADVASQLRTELNKTKEEQGLIGKTWDGIKNLFGMKAGSDNVEKTIEKLENGEISQEEAQEVLTKYQDGQKMCVDVVGDMVSGIVAVGCAAAAPFTGGASLLVAAGAGAAVKVTIKGVDCAVGGRDYKLKDFGYDLITGSINGAMAPVTNALGGVAGTGVAKACGLNFGKMVVKETGEEVFEQTVKQTGKSFLTNLLAKQGTEYVAKEGAKIGLKTTMAKVAAYGADMAVDGALGGATDGFARSLADGDFENMGENVTQGFAGGLIAAPIIGGGFRLAGKAGSKVGSKLSGNTAANTVSNNAGNLANEIAGASTPSGLAITTREVSENVAETLSDSATREISDGVANVVADSTDDAIIKETSESIADGITDVSVKEASELKHTGATETKDPFTFINDEIADESSISRTNALKAKADECGIILDEIQYEQLLHLEECGYSVNEILGIVKKIKTNIPEMDEDNLSFIVDSLIREVENDDALTNVAKGLDEKFKYIQSAKIDTKEAIDILVYPKVIDSEASLKIRSALKPKILEMAESGYWNLSLLCPADNFDIQMDKVNSLNQLASKYLTDENNQFIGQLFNTEYTNVRQLKSSIEYLNSLTKKDISKHDFEFIMGNDLSYSINARKGTTNIQNGAVATKRKDLLVQLAQMSDENGIIKLTNTDIDAILNSENGIENLSKIVKLLQDENIQLSRTTLTELLTKEGVNLKAIQNNIEVINRIQTIDNGALYKRLCESEYSTLNDVYTILGKSNLSIDDFDSLYNSGLLDDVDDFFALSSLLSAKINDSTDIGKRIKLIKDLRANTEYIYNAQTLKQVLELDLPNDAELNIQNIEFFRKYEDIFDKQTLAQKIKLITTDKIFDSDASEFLDEVMKLTPDTDLNNFIFAKFNLGNKIDLSQLLLENDIDFKKATEVLRTIEKYDLYDIFKKENIVQDMLDIGVENFASAVDKAQLIKQYPQIQENLDFNFGSFAQTLNPNISNEEFIQRLQLLHAFMEENSELLNSLNKNNIDELIINALNVEDASEILILDSERINLAKAINAMIGNNENQELNYLLGEVMGDANLNIRNVQANLQYIDALNEIRSKSVTKKTALFADNISEYDEYRSPDDITQWLNSNCDMGKAIQVIQREINSSPNEALSFKCYKDSFAIISGSDKNYKVTTYGIDGEFKLEKSVTMGSTLNPNLRISKINDGQNNYEITENFEIIEHNGKKKQYYYPIKEVSEIRDSNGKLLYTETRALSDVDGVVEIVRKYPDGKIENLCETIEDTNGNKTIIKNLTSLDGTKTQVNYESDLNGNYTQKYVIIDKDGNILLDDTKTFKKIDENTFISSHNGVELVTTYTNDKIAVCDMSGNILANIDINSLIQTDREVLINMLKGLSGEELISASKYVKKLILQKRMDSAINWRTGEMYIGPHKFIFEHELGHGKDSFSITNPQKMHLSISDPNIRPEDITFRISGDKQLQEIFNEEKTAFKNNLTTEQGNYVEYFMNSGNIPTLDHGLSETVAETNAILNSPNSQITLSFRTQYLQQYFPKTIAYISKMLDE